jgi:hypothetical protein
MASRMEHLDKRSVQYSSSYFINRALVAIRKHLNNMTAILTEHLKPVQSRIDLGELSGRADPSPSCKSHDGPPWRKRQA